MRGARYIQRIASMAGILGWGRNPLRRPTDQIESMVVLVATVLAVVTVPLAISIGTATYHRNLAVSARETAGARPVTATLTQDTSVAVQTSMTIATVSAEARCIFPAGRLHTGVIQAPEASQASAAVRVWVDAFAPSRA